MSEGNLINKIDGLGGGSFSREWRRWGFLMRNENMQKYVELKHEFLPSCKIPGKERELVQRYHDRPKLNVDYKLWAVSRSLVLYEVEKLIESRSPKTLEEALMYLDDAKSTGILLRETYPDLVKTNKGSFFDENMDEVRSLLEKIDEGLLPLSIFSGWLKDELLPKLKVEIEKKCRLFMAASAEHVIISHTLFVAQNKDMYSKCWPNSWSGIGMNKFQGFWPRLRQRMLDIRKDNPNLVVASYDGKRHDASCQEEEFEDVAFWRYSRLKDAHKYLHRVKYVYRNIIYTVVVTEEGEIHFVKGGNKSGQGNTTTDNGLIQFRRLVYALLVMNRMDVIKSFTEKFPPLIILGDDVMCFSPLLSKEDHLQVAQIIGKHVGAVWTVKISDINNWEFCSHSPTPHSNYELAAINVGKMVCSLYRTHTFETNEDRVKGELIESYPTPFFDDLYAFAQSYFRQKGIALRTKDFYRDHWFGEQNLQVSELNRKSLEKDILVNFYPNIEIPNMSKAQLQRKVKERGKQIHQQNQQLARLKQNAMAGNSHKNTGAACDCVQKFVMDIIDPEHSDDLRWPDSYSERTSCYKAWNNFFLPVALNDHLDYGKGSYYWQVHPELLNTIRYIEEFDGSTTISPVSATISTGSPGNVFGFYDSDFRRVNSALTNGLYDMAFDWVDRGGTPQTPSFVGPTEATVFERGFWNLPAIGSSQYNVKFLMYNRGTSANVTIEQVDSDGNIIALVGPTLVAHGGLYQDSLDLASSVDGRFSFKLRMNIEAVAPGFPMFMGTCEACYLQDFLKFVNEPLTATTTLLNNVEKARIVAQSCLVTYVGSKLTTAGDCTALLYRGGTPAAFNAVVDYSTVAEHPDSYEGYMSDGTYSYWEGQDDLDYTFRNIFSNETFRRPYMIGAGKYTGDPTTGVIAGADIIRVRIVTAIEFTSKSQVFSSNPSPVNPDLIVAAFRVLAGVQNAMENGKHMRKLKQIANKAYQYLKKAAPVIYENREAILNGVKTLAPLMLV